MYTEELLRNEKYIRIYKYIGKNSIKTLIKVEEMLAKRKNTSDLDIHLDKEAFVTRDNIMHYTNSVHLNKSGTYLNTNITKTKNSNLLDITLELGIIGYDLSTGERFDRKKAKVDYTYENDKVDIKNIEDEIYYNNLENQKYEDIKRQVLNLKK